MAVFLTGGGVIPTIPRFMSDYAVSESVFIPISGTPKEFIVVSQGRPSTDYDKSCIGTWLLMKDIYEKRAFDSSNHDYENSDIHTYLNGDFLNLFNSKIRNAIKQIKIPYRAGTGSGTTVTVGENGLSAKLFLLSCEEIGFSGQSNTPVEGKVLKHFKDATNATRIAYLNGTANAWWTRTPDLYNGGSLGSYAWTATNGGASNRYGVTLQSGIRPALVLPYDTKFDPDTNEVIA